MILKPETVQSETVRDNGSGMSEEPRNRRPEESSEERTCSFFRDDDGSTTLVDGREREGDEKTYLCIPQYEPLKHFFKIYINNFPGAKDLRAKLMETHSVAEARAIIES